MVDGAGQRAGDVVENGGVELGVAIHPRATGLARKRRDRAGVDRLDRQPVGVVRLEAAHVARHIEGENLSASVAGHFHRAKHAPHDKEVIVSRIALAHHFLTRRIANDDRFGIRKQRGHIAERERIPAGRSA